MRPIATDGAAWSIGRSVCLSVTTMSPAETAEPIEIPFGMWTWVNPKNHVVDGVQISTREGTILRAQMGRLRTCPDMSDGEYT